MDNLNAVLEIAKQVLVEQHPNNTRLYRLANYIVENLGPAQPCGYGTPEVFRKGEIYIPTSGVFAVEDARGYVHAILEACHEAEV